MRDEHRLPVIRHAEFAVRILEASHQQPVWLLFSASWCMPCRLLEPQLHQLMQDSAGVQIYKCDIEQDAELAARHQVQSLPVVKCFRNGVLVDEFAGMLPMAKMRALLARQQDGSSSAR